ncbi:ferrous iron transport protein A [bacterium]|nr:ferrous iron transport protein A [bacterium]
MNNKKNLSDLHVGQKCKVVDFHIEDLDLRRHFFNMGITKNVVIEIKRVAPLGDPVVINLRGYNLCVRKKDMKNIDVYVI